MFKGLFSPKEQEPAPVQDTSESEYYYTEDEIQYPADQEPASNEETREAQDQQHTQDQPEPQQPIINAVVPRVANNTRISTTFKFTKPSRSPTPEQHRHSLRRMWRKIFDLYRSCEHMALHSTDDALALEQRCYALKRKLLKLEKRLNK